MTTSDDDGASLVSRAGVPSLGGVVIAYGDDRASLVTDRGSVDRSVEVGCRRAVAVDAGAVQADNQTPKRTSTTEVKWRNRLTRSDLSLNIGVFLAWIVVWPRLYRFLMDRASCLSAVYLASILDTS